MRMTIANNIKKILPKTDSAKEFLLNVEDHFKTADKSLAGTLIAKLTTMKFDGKRGIHEHAIEMTNLAAQLKTLEMNVDEFFLNQFILNSLPPQYGPFQINYNTMKDKWNVNQLAIMLNQEEERLKQLEQHSIHLINQEVERKWRKPKKGLKHGSRKASDPTPTGQPQNKENDDYNCHFCKKFRHFKKDCPKRRQWFETKGISLIKGYIYVCFESNLIEVPFNTWWLDSGATTHISNTVQRFLSIQTINPNKNFVLTGNRGKAPIEAIGTYRLFLDTNKT